MQISSHSDSSVVNYDRKLSIRLSTHRTSLCSFETILWQFFNIEFRIFSNDIFLILKTKKFFLNAILTKKWICHLKALIFYGNCEFSIFKETSKSINYKIRTAKIYLKTRLDLSKYLPLFYKNDPIPAFFHFYRIKTKSRLHRLPIL